MRQKMIMKIAFECCCLALLSACIKPSYDGTCRYKSPGYIYVYETIYMIDVAPKNISKTLGSLYVCGRYYTGAEAYVKLHDPAYYDLCVKYGDLKPGGQCCHVDHGIFFGTGAIAIAEAIDEIHIISSEKWDSSHAAGELLDDVYVAEYISYFPYIRNSYKANNPQTYCRKYFSEIRPGDMYLSWNIVLKPQILPESSGQHTLTVSIILDTGEVIEYDVEVDFSEATQCKP